MFFKTSLNKTLRLIFCTGLFAAVSVAPVLASSMLAPPNDNRNNATVLSNLNNWCSALAGYNNNGATPDGAVSQCGSPFNNVWFKFQAATSYFKFDVKSGATEGTIVSPEIALWTEAGAEVLCQNGTGGTDDVSLLKTDLVIGQWYYISVYTSSVSSGNQGTFAICATNQGSFDNKSFAVELTQKNNFCSTLAAYNNVGATADGSTSACGAPNNNVWFKFQASTSYFKFDVKTGASEGTIVSPEIALWNDAGVEIQCQNSTGTSGDVSLERSNLVIGQWYYISVYTANSLSSNQGTFSICATDQGNFDNQAFAVELMQKNNFCSALAAYNNVGATGDGSAGACGSPNNNVWFKFNAATSYFKFDVRTGGTEGTLVSPEIALWNAAGTEIQCVNSTGTSDDVSFERSDLVIGQWYYISVYTANSLSANQGTFSICATDQVSPNNKVNAVELTQKNNFCSALAAYHNVGATADGSISACGPPNNNVWFKFQAATSYFKFDVKTGGTEGTIVSPEIALWDNAGTEIVCQNSTGTSADVTLERFDLVIGQWYYISVYTANSGTGNQGTFSICATERGNFDNKIHAVELAQKNNFCSALGEYSNVGATADGSPGSCGMPYNNVWFKFQAATSYFKFDVKTGGTEGTIVSPEIALTSNSGTEILCRNATGSSGDASFEISDLVVGQWYYISVYTASSSSGSQGTFTICANDQGNFDDKAFAVELAQKNNFCSALAQYSNQGASPDVLSSTCGQLNNNVWFKFQAATAFIKIGVKTGGGEGTLENFGISLRDNAGTEILCQSGSSTTEGDLSIVKSDLAVGQWYYISVYAVQYNVGTFTICINDQISFDQKEAAVLLNQKNNWCSGLAAYNNINATADGISSPCGVPKNNVWFKFQAATKYIQFQVKTGSTEGTMAGPEISLFDSTGGFSPCRTGGPDVCLEKTDLIIGEWYYLSVSTISSLPSAQGSFTVCVNDQAPYNYKEGAIEIAEKSDWCSEEGAYNNSATSNCATIPHAWFKFKASSNFIRVQVTPGNGTPGTNIYNPTITLYDSSATIVASDIGPSQNVSVEISNLTVSQWYYVKVSNTSQGSPGLFTLCVDDHCLLPVNNHTVFSSPPVCYGEATGWVHVGGSDIGVTYALNQLDSAGTGYAIQWNNLPANQYILKVRRGACDLIRTDTIQINEHAPIESFSLFKSGPGLCGKDTVGLYGSAINVGYQLKRDSLAAGQAVAGTGSALKWFPLYASGRYTVEAIHSQTGCRLEMPGTVELACNFIDLVSVQSVAIATDIVPDEYRLAVGAKILTMGINLKVPELWPDYVFDERYKLPTLDEVHAHIRMKGHLPSMLSAKEMAEKKYYGASEMDMKLLEKIEELTLYTLEIGDEISKVNDETSGKDEDKQIDAEKGLSIVNESDSKETEILNSQAQVRNHPVSFVSEGFTDLRIKKTLAIGTSRPMPEGFGLMVQGNILAVGLDIKPTANWPDYVFSETYSLLPLADVKAYVNQHGHLPGMSSADEMKALESYDCAEMDSKLLEKIEELTLYIIELKAAAHDVRMTASNRSGLKLQPVFSNDAAGEITFRKDLSKNVSLTPSFTAGQVSAWERKVFSSDTDPHQVLPNTSLAMEEVKVSESMSIATTRKVANYKLLVAGNIIATGANFKPPHKWPDYVFGADYKLLSLDELREFIAHNKHLPNVKSAYEMQQQGDYNLAEMDVKLLEKIEELTLYLVQLQERIKEIHKSSKE